MAIRQTARSLAIRVPLIRQVVLHRDQLLRESTELRDRLSVVERKLKTASSILDVYVSSPPGRDAGFRLFDGAWSSIVPGYGLGAAPLFDDYRIKWFEQQCGGVKG